MLNFLKGLGNCIPPVVWDTAIRVVLWIRQLKIFKKMPRIAAEEPTQSTVYRTCDLDESKKLLKVYIREEAIRSRSISNERLVIYFRIENAFTTMSVESHNIYVQKVKNLLKTQSPYADQTMVNDIFEREKAIFLEEHGEKLPFKKYVMTASFKFAIKRFVDETCNPDISEKEMSGLSYQAAKFITSLWLESKKGSVDEEKQRILFEVLKKIFPRMNVEETSKNPLGMILPSFETLWRVLYRLSVFLKVAENSNEFIEILKAFGDNPCTHTYKNVQNGISVENIVKEILFISPPTGTIYRKDKNNNDVAVDIKKLHENYMGDHKGFYPQRWGDDTKEMPFFTFGYHKLSCPAKTFAPIILGLMGAKIFDIFKEYEWKINFEEFNSFGNLNTQEKTNDRDKYPEFYLIKRII